MNYDLCESAVESRGIGNSNKLIKCEGCEGGSHE